jgi:hypothetical protein
MSRNHPTTVSMMTAEQQAYVQAAAAETHPGVTIANVAVLFGDRDRPIETTAFFVVESGRLGDFLEYPPAIAAMRDADSIIIAFEGEADFLVFMTLRRGNEVMN